VLLLDEEHVAGVHRIQDVAEFQRVFPFWSDGPLLA
jgi:hypothetical protein